MVRRSVQIDQSSLFGTFLRRLTILTLCRKVLFRFVGSLIPGNKYFIAKGNSISNLSKGS